MTTKTKSERLRIIDADIDRIVEQYRKTRSSEDLEQVIKYVRPSLFKLAKRHGRKYGPNFLDAFQDSLAWLVENIDLPDLKQSVVACMYRIFNDSYRRNNCLPAKRSTTKRVYFLSELTFDDGNPMIEIEAREEPTSDDPQDNWDAKVRALHEAMEELSPRMKEAIHGYFFMNNMTLIKLGETMGCDHVQVYRQLESAKGRLERNNKLRTLFGLPPVVEIKKEKAILKGDLTAYQREVVRLLHVEKLSRAQVMRQLGIGSGSVRDAWLGALKKITKSKKLQEETGIFPGMYGI